MRRLICLALLLALLGLVACGDTKRLAEENQVLANELERARLEAEARDSYLMEVSETLQDVTALIDQMQQEERAIGRLVIEVGEPGHDRDARRSVSARLQTLRDYLARNAETIDELEERLARVPEELEQLRQTVAWLRIQNVRIETRAAEHLATIEGLQKQVRELTAQVEEQAEELEQRDEVIALQRSDLEEGERQLESAKHELLSVYYVVGTRRELIDRGIVERATKTPLFGRRLRLSAQVESLSHQFEKIRMDLASELPLPPGKGDVKLVPDRPPATYEVVSQGGARVLQIRALSEFWVSKYLAVVVK